MDSIVRGVEFAKKLVRDRYGKSEFRLRFAVNTNGTLLDDSVVEFLERENFRIYLSLDGHEAHHDVCRKQVGGA